MEQQVTSIIGHLAKSHMEMAKIIESKRHIIVQMASIMDEIPDYPSFCELQQMTQSSVLVVDSVTSYLNSIADLEEAIAENLTSVMQELSTDSEEE
ncbi:nucleoside-diphosphate sugar epimerase [Paenibacillus gansuensis]|uniref:Nucleoside-diphosphate sugar epimerase n=1 Tax=Paenibacillus gansuensis TaxID=306542 RepID=A0ABW5PB84_9BACL